MTGDSSGNDTEKGESDERNDSSSQSATDGDGRDAGFFESFPDPVVRYTVRDGVAEIRAVNDAFESVFNVDEVEAVGDSLESHLRAEAVERIPDADGREATTSQDSTGAGKQAEGGAEASESGVPTSLHSDPDMTGILPHDLNGDRRYFQLRSVRVGNTTDSGYLVFTDVTKIKQRACKWEQMANRLERFVSVAAHDIRNPLEVADIRLEAARDSHEDVHFEKVAGSLDRIQQIVDDVLSVGKTSIEPSDGVAVNECAEEAWDTVDTADATLTVSTTLPVIRADRNYLQQLFENLFRNAVEHGGRDVTVSVGSLSDGFYVEDDGVGIPEEERERVFEASYSTTDDNTGLGLAIVTQIAEAHGWRVGLTTADSGGARFKFTGVRDTDESN